MILYVLNRMHFFPTKTAPKMVKIRSISSQIKKKK